MFFMELASFFSSRQRSNPLDMCSKCASDSGSGHGVSEGSRKINLSRGHEPLSHVPSPSCRQLLNGSVGLEQSWMEACGTAEVWSVEHTRALRGPLQAQRHHPDTHQARNTLRGCRLLVYSMDLFILSGAYGRGDSQGGFGNGGKEQVAQESKLEFQPTLLSPTLHPTPARTVARTHTVTHTTSPLKCLLVGKHTQSCVSIHFVCLLWTCQPVTQSWAWSERGSSLLNGS